MKKYFLLVALIFCTVVTINSQNKHKVSDYQYIVKIGDMAPDFMIRQPNGHDIRLSALRGKVVMLQFTASWCPVCRREMFHIENEIWQKNKRNPKFALFGIDRGENKQKVIDFGVQMKITYPLALDINERIFALYAKKEAGVTRNVIIDKNGRIVMLTRLYDETEFHKMVSLIDKLLAN